MPYTVTPTPLPDVLILQAQVFNDERGFFFESFNQREFERATGSPTHFVQDNHSRSAHKVLRGLHYQIQHPQAKLVRVIAGKVFDVVVDIRRHSKHFGQWFGLTLSAENKQQLWIPAGFAHGFLVLSQTAEFLYKTSDYWFAKHERCLLWNDPTLNINWPLTSLPLLALKDAAGARLEEAEVFE